MLLGIANSFVDEAVLGSAAIAKASGHAQILDEDLLFFLGT